MQTIHDLVAAYGGAFAGHLWNSTLWLAAALTAGLTLPRLTARTRYAILLLGVAKFAIPSAAIASLIAKIRPAQPPETDSVLSFLASLPLVPPAPAAAVFGWREALALTWVCIAAAMFLRWVLIRRRLSVSAMRTATAPSPREVAALQRARTHIGVRQAVDLVRTSVSEAPAVLRVVRPVIVLPAAGCDDLGEDELESLLEHECAHLKRRDNLAGVFEAALWSLFWFHPLLWIAHQQLGRTREQACDEQVAAIENRSGTYLTALAKMCRLALVPRVHGVSCMASAKLKERIESIMNYPSLHARALSHGSITAVTAVLLALFTVGAALVSRSATATETKAGPYALRIDVARAGKKLNIRATITENTTGAVVAQPSVIAARNETFRSGAKTDDVEFEIAGTTDQSNRVSGTFVVRQGSSELQRLNFKATVADQPAAAPNYSGEPITLNLKDADLRDVLKTFGRITGMEIRAEDGVAGKVTVSWVNVPWDQAFDALLKERGLIYRIEKGVIYVTRSK